MSQGKHKILSANTLSLYLLRHTKFLWGCINNILTFSTIQTNANIALDIANIATIIHFAQFVQKYKVFFYI